MFSEERKGKEDGYSLHKDRTHYYWEEADKNREELLKQERAMKRLLQDLNSIIKEQKGNLKIITPTAYKEFYDESILLIWSELV